MSGLQQYRPGTPPAAGVTIICFSATASFSSGLALCAIGAITVLRAGNRRAIPFAAIPLIFGMQQLVEGGLWLSLAGHSVSTHGLTVAYLLFSNVLWPLYVPLAVWLMEPSAAHRRRIGWTVPAGAAISLYFLAAILSHPVSSAIEGMHIKYRLPHMHQELAFAFYAVATCLAPLLSSHKTVRWFGGLIVISMIIAYVIYTMWFASVWCFFAALASGLVAAHFFGPYSRSRAGAAEPLN